MKPETEVIACCRKCGVKLIGKNAIDVGYCIPCFHETMADDEDRDESWFTDPEEGAR